MYMYMFYETLKTIYVDQHFLKKIVFSLFFFIEGGLGLYSPHFLLKRELVLVHLQADLTVIFV